MKKAIIENKFSWSFSRSKLFAECARKYYYHYYGAWGGGDVQADEINKTLYRLRNMKNLYMWAGEITHKVIKEILENKKRKTDIFLDEANRRAENLIKSGWSQSLNKGWLKSPKYALNLFEHYYSRKITQEIIDKKLRKKVYGSLANFYRSGFLNRLSGVPSENYLTLESLDNFQLDQTTIYVVPDFAVKTEFFYLYDWKTGLPCDDDVLQLSAYALYAQAKWGIPLEKIKVVPVYLIQENISYAPVDKLDIKKVKSYIRDSIACMKSLLTDTGPNQACIDDFAKTDDLRKCNSCFFQEVCKQ